ncbi:hypothetical protein, partial [Gluconobacter kondonii]|uniref:hypothetical protein n=1 Tax=Gluconobacter kondonii TaxID=941463 RepID=UPI00222E2E22
SVPGSRTSPCAPPNSKGHGGGISPPRAHVQARLCHAHTPHEQDRAMSPTDLLVMLAYLAGMPVAALML